MCYIPVRCAVRQWYVHLFHDCFNPRQLHTDAFSLILSPALSIRHPYVATSLWLRHAREWHRPSKDGLLQYIRGTHALLCFFLLSLYVNHCGWLLFPLQQSLHTRWTSALSSCHQITTRLLVFWISSPFHQYVTLRLFWPTFSHLLQFPSAPQHSHVWLPTTSNLAICPPWAHLLRRPFEAGCIGYMILRYVLRPNPPLHPKLTCFPPAVSFTLTASPAYS